MNAEPGNERRNMVLMVLAVVAVLALVAYGLKGMLSGSDTTAKKPPKISLIPMAPPPPPPPPKEEKKPPEPPKVENEVKAAPVEKQEQPPADPALKMEGAAGDGPSMFSSGKVVNEDLSRIGKGTTIGGDSGRRIGDGVFNAFNGYAGTIKTELQRHLAQRSDLRRRRYEIELRLWVGDDGRLKNFELIGTTQDGDTDEAIRKVLATLPAFSEPPPAKMPQPIRLRIVTEGRA